MQELDLIGEVGCNGKLDGFVADIMIIDVVGRPRGVPMIAGFVGLQRAEAR